MFTKSDLKNGDVCVQRDGTTEIYLANSPAGPVFLTYGRNGYYGWNDPADKGEHLESVFGETGFDIVKVFRTTTPKAYGHLRSLLDGNPAEDWDCIFDRSLSAKELYNDIVHELTNFEHADEDPEMADSDWAAVFYDLLVKVQNSIDIGDLIIRKE